MKRYRFGIAVVAVASVAAAVGAGPGMTGSTPAWLQALEARSEALNKEYGLGDYAQRHALGAPGPGWKEALMARSDAMNRRYGLGNYSRQTARSSTTPGTVSYPSHVIGAGGRYWNGLTLPPPAGVQAAPAGLRGTATASDDDFEWTSFGAGAGVAGLLAAVLAGGVVSIRKRRTVRLL
jgi:hypothetical protein